MTSWNGWPLERVVLLFLGVAFFAIGIQVTLSHYRQNFHHKSMLAPVISSPLFCITALWLVFARAGWLFTLFVIFMWLGVVIGGAGVHFHFHGVGVRVGGYTSRNFLVGPPVVLPLMFAALCVLGLVVYYWR